MDHVPASLSDGPTVVGLRDAKGSQARPLSNCNALQMTTRQASYIGSDWLLPEKLGLQATAAGRLFGICPPRGHGGEGKYATWTRNEDRMSSPVGTGFDNFRGLANGPWGGLNCALFCKSAHL